MFGVKARTATPIRGRPPCDSLISAGWNKSDRLTSFKCYGKVTMHVEFVPNFTVPE